MKEPFLTAYTFKETPDETELREPTKAVHGDR
jgi:hypothetical protein